MSVDVTIPSPGESITEVVLGPWHKQEGEWVDKDETIVEIESDKVTLEVPAPESGVLHVTAHEGDEMVVGQTIASIDPSAAPPAGAAATATATASINATTAATAINEVATATVAGADTNGHGKATSLARKVAADKGVDVATLHGTGPSGRVRKADVLAASATTVPATTVTPTATPTAAPDTLPTTVTTPGKTSSVVTGERGVRRERMTRLRQRIAERLVTAQHTAAMLTTFNEADMTRVMDLRSRHKEAFLEKHGVGLGFMSFFAHACVTALQAYPRVNAYIVGDEVEYHDYIDLSVAVGTDKGLVVPVVRNAERLSFAEIESTIKDYAVRAQAGKLGIDEMTGGTFTISNGGVYGSLNSTPILNPPQSGILGMHRIQKRPVEDPDNPGQIALRPMMYLAMSYDHRIVDGSEAVGFLVTIKQCLEDPERMLLGM